jgi:hypothetical protein
MRTCCLRPSSRPLGPMHGSRAVRAGSDRARARHNAGRRSPCCARHVHDPCHAALGSARLTSAPPCGAPRRSVPGRGRGIDPEPGSMGRNRGGRRRGRSCHHGRGRRIGRCVRRCRGRGRSRQLGRGRRRRCRSSDGCGGWRRRHGQNGRRRSRRSTRDGRRIDRRGGTARGQQRQRIQISLCLRRQAHAEMHVGLWDLAVAARADRADGTAFDDLRGPVHADRAEMRERDRVSVGRLDGDAPSRRRDRAGEAHRSRRGREHG